MSAFACEVIKVGKIWKNPNADSLMVTEALGCPVQFRTGDYQEGSLAVYIPVDAMVPTNSPIFSFLKDPNHPDRTVHRVKARRLRQIFSMGMLVPLPVGAKEGEDLSAILGVQKFEEADDQEFEPEEIPKGPWRKLTSALNKRIFQFLYKKSPQDPKVFPVYDIESVRKYQGLLQMGEEVVITEKIHGQNARFGWHYNAGPNDGPLTKFLKRRLGMKFYIGSRTNFKSETSKSNWAEVAHNLDLKRKLRQFPNIAVYGEVFGLKVQDLTYGQTGRAFRVFDVLDLKTGRWLGYDEAKFFCKEVGLEMCPVLYRGGWRGLEYHAPMAEGPTTVNSTGDKPCIREGWVVKPVQDRRDPRHGRVILKLVGEQYHLRKGGTEKH